MNNGEFMNKYSIIHDYAINNGCKAVFDEPMSKHTSFKIGGNAALFVIPESVEALKKLLNKCKSENVRTFILGNGSNMLVSDEGIDAVVISMCNENDRIEYLGDGKIKASAGVSLMKVCRFVLEKSLSGLEFAYGIPGSVGGAVFMNAGAYGGEIKDVIIESECINSEGEIVTHKIDDMKLSYRSSVYSKSCMVITSAVFQLKEKDQALIKADMEDFMQRRRSKQPVEYPSAGSVFKRPVGNFAGTLIEQCALKGKTIGGAQVSTKHAGFIINIGGATASDVVSLVKFIQDTVKNETGVELEPEIRIVK